MTDDAAVIYEQLAAPFPQTYRDPRGYDYLTGEQVVSRLNRVLGVHNWTLTVKQQGYDPEADEIWVLVRLEACIADRTVAREQYGSQKSTRRKMTKLEIDNGADRGALLDRGFDLKGATTDGLKKAASLLGVGLYLYVKPGWITAPAQSGNAGRPDQRSTVAGGPTNPDASDSGQPRALVCNLCSTELKEVRFRDGTVWSPAALAKQGVDRFGVTLCMGHYRARANSAKPSTSAQADGVPF